MIGFEFEEKLLSEKKSLLGLDRQASGVLVKKDYYI